MEALEEMGREGGERKYGKSKKKNINELLQKVF